MTVAGRTADERTILEFFASWEQAGIDRLLSCFAPEARFLNAAYPDMPVPPRCGHEQIRGYLEGLFAGREVRIEVRRIASNDAGDIFTERTDWVRAPGSGWVALPVAGVMEMRDGKIAEWREYLDTRVLEDGLGIKIERQQV